MSVTGAAAAIIENKDQLNFNGNDNSIHQRTESGLNPTYGRVFSCVVVLLCEHNRTQITKMETSMTTQLKELKGEIDELSKEIREEKKKRDNTADVAEKGIILESIAVLYSERAARSATRDALLLRNPVPAPAPGKNPPLALDASVPPLHAHTQHPPLVVASLSSSTRFKPCFEPRFKPRPNSRPCVRTGLVCPSCEEG